MTRAPITDVDAPRSWDPRRRCSERVLEHVLDLLVRAGGPVTQADLAARLHSEMRQVCAGTAKGYVCAALLAFLQEGWVECVGRQPSNSHGGPPTAVWRVVE